MSNLRRYYSDDSIYFVTCVTFNREQILLDNSDYLHNALRRLTDHETRNLIAWVIMPDHLHIVIEPGSTNLSDLIHNMKLSFGAMYRKRHSLYSGRVWQHRFWDHLIRDEQDMNNHIDYIHFNSVKHGFVRNPFEWRQSSIHDYRVRGFYADDWGCMEELTFSGEFGE